MEILFLKERGVDFVVLNGELSLENFVDTHKRIDDYCAANAGIKHLSIDLTHLTYVDSSGLGAFIRAKKMMSTRGAKFSLCGPSDQVLKVFHLGGFDKFFTIFPKRADVC
ncbi:MAG: STAS domain-containing protein [Spirochaetota bacterium]